MKMGQTTKPRVSWLCSYRFGAKNGPANKLREALDQLEHVTTLHGALKKSFLSIYGYTSDEQGIRHPLIDADAAKFDETDALFMIGACGNHLGGVAPAHLPGWLLMRVLACESASYLDPWPNRYNALQLNSFREKSGGHGWTPIERA